MLYMYSVIYYFYTVINGINKSIHTFNENLEILRSSFILRAFSNLYKLKYANLIYF